MLKLNQKHESKHSKKIWRQHKKIRLEKEMPQDDICAVH